MKNVLFILFVLSILYQANSKLTFQQAIELDLSWLNCDRLDEINIIILDIEEWKIAIEKQEQLVKDYNGLLELESIVKSTKKSLHIKNSYIQMENRIGVMSQSDFQSKFEDHLSKIMKLMQSVNQQQNKSDKLEILAEIEVCIQAAKQKLTYVLNQIQNYNDDDYDTLIYNLQVLTNVNQQCSIKQELQYYEEEDNNYENNISQDFEVNSDYFDDYSNQYEELQSQINKRTTPKKIIKQKRKVYKDKKDYNKQKDSEIQQSQQDTKVNNDYDALSDQSQINIINNSHIVDINENADMEKQIDNHNHIQINNSNVKLDDNQNENIDNEETLQYEYNEEISFEENQDQPQIIYEEYNNNFEENEEEINEQNDQEQNSEIPIEPIRNKKQQKLIKLDDEYIDENQLISTDDIQLNNQVEQENSDMEFNLTDETNQNIEEQYQGTINDQQEMQNDQVNSQVTEPIQSTAQPLEEKAQTSSEKEKEKQSQKDQNQINQKDQETSKQNETNSNSSLDQAKLQDNQPQKIQQQEDPLTQQQQQKETLIKQEVQAQKPQQDENIQTNEQNLQQGKNQNEKPIEPTEPIQQQQIKQEQSNSENQNIQNNQQTLPEQNQQQTQPIPQIPTQENQKNQNNGQDNQQQIDQTKIESINNTQSVQQQTSQQQQQQEVQQKDVKENTSLDKQELSSLSKSSENIINQQPDQQQNQPSNSQITQTQQQTATNNQEVPQMNNDKSTTVNTISSQNPDQLIDPVKFIPFKHKPLQSTTSVLLKQSKYYDSFPEGKECYMIEFSNRELQDSEEYGYGYWVRYQSTQEFQMKKGQYHFLSRMTSLKDYLDFQNYGDRTLAVFLVDTTFVFATYDYVNKDKNKISQISLNQNIDGRWFFVSFSYSSRKQKAVGFILNYGESKHYERIEIPCTHAPPFYLQIIIGGKHLHYSGINGQFANIFYDIESPALVENEEQLFLLSETLSFMPQALRTYHEELIIGPPIDLDGNVRSSQDKGFKDAFIYQQYAIAGWFRWVDNLDVKELNSFQIFNLRSNKIRTQTPQLGDRTLEIHFIRAIQNIGIDFRTYSVSGNDGKGQEAIVKQILYSQNIWTYAYFGFNQDLKKAYGVIIKPGQNEEVIFENLEHKHANSLYFTLGGDQQVASFNGRVAQVGIYLGPEAFTTNKMMNYNFGYGDGAILLFQLVRPLILRGQQDNYEIAFDQEQPIINQILVQDDKNIKINGLSEYSIGLWTCWLSSTPKYIGQRAEYHQIIRMGTSAKLLELKDNKLVQVEKQIDPTTSSAIKDITLQIRLAKNEYEFSTYTIGSNEIKKGVIAFNQQLEGTWNYLYFTYKKMNERSGLSKGYVQFGVNGQINEISIETLHDYINEYVELVVGQSIIQQFNGKLSNVQMRIGNGAFLLNIEQFTQFQQLEKPPMSNLITQRQTIKLINQEKDILTIQEKENIFEFAQFSGVGEYSISGWIKWTGEQKQGGLFNIVMLIQKKLLDIKQGQSDSQLYIQRTDKNIIFGTYNCNNDDCSQNVEKNVEYGEYYNQWTYLYLGYSQKIKKLFGYCKFTFNQQSQNFDGNNRILLSSFTLFLGKRYQMANQWVGLMKYWVINVGDGSFIENGYEQKETMEINFGYSSGSDHLKLQSTNQEISHEELLDCQADKQNIPWMFEITESQNQFGIAIEGATTYGYSMWTRFRFYSTNILYTQPKWMGVSRLTSNVNYKDADTAGDRILMILFGQNEQGQGVFQFSTYTIGKSNLSGQILYPIEYESEWVYLYYSYKRISQTQGIAVAYSGRQEIVEELKIDAQHNPLSQYLLFLVGNSGKYYPNFNGQISNVKFRLGNGAFIDNKNEIFQRIRNIDLIPKLPYDAAHKFTILDGKVDNFKTIPNNPQLVDFPANEYSMALWYKYVSKISDNRETVFRVTQNPKLADMTWIGDRTLVLQKSSKDTMEFSTYTLLKQFNFNIPYHCQIPDLSQHSWTFAYIAYSKQLKRIYYYLSVDEYLCKSEEVILHAVSDRMWAFIGNDNLAQQFEGNLAQIAITIGPGSYTNSKVPFLQEYLIADKLFPKKQKISWEKSDQISLNYDGADEASSLQVELHNGPQYPFESMNEYSYGFWCRYLTAIPDRQFSKPVLSQVAKLTINRESDPNVIKIGDRVLAIHLLFNFYQISTYDLNTESEVQQQFLKYNQLEGIWRYIYIGYNKEIETVLCFTFDTEIKEIRIDKILHKPLSDYLQFRIGKEGAIPGFQGMIAKITLSIGPGSFIQTQDQFKSQLETTFSLPFQLTQEYTDKQKHGKFEILGDNTEIDLQGGLQFEGNRWSGISEYSFSGWFKWSGKEEKSDNCQALIRLTNNDQNHLSDYKSQGDRALYASLCNNGHISRFSTYTLIGLKEANEAKFIDGQLELGDYNYAWNYIYLGYNYRSNEVHLLIHTLENDKQLLWDKILHIVPGYLALYVGEDKFTNKFIGQMNKWTAAYGLGAFVSLKRSGYEQLLAYYNLIQPNKQFQWQSNKDTVISTPDNIMQEFTNEVDSITEYAFGMWTRWLTDFPDHLIERKDSHALFRLTGLKDHSDKSNYGDRVLSAFLKKGSYEFSTYDLDTQNISLSELAPYQQIEGSWNFIFMAYKNGQIVGIIIIKDTQKALKIEIKAKHVPLIGYAKLLIGVSEFGHAPFHGWIYDPRLYFGKGSFLSESQKVVDLLQKIHRKIPLSQSQLSNFKWAIPQMDTTESIQKAYIDYKFLDKQEAIEYSFGMWIQQAALLPGMPNVPRLIGRLTTNHPQFMRDDQLGDRTLLITKLEDEIEYTTYQLLDPPAFNSKTEKLKIDPLQWTYVFFQYKREETLAYALQVQKPFSIKIPAFHIIPNVFYFYVVKDQHFAEFYGKISDVKVYFGQSSFFSDPQTTIEKWPFDKKYLQPIPNEEGQNNQITSAKISRNVNQQYEKYNGDF